jgi:hypothetical protein
MLLQLGDDALDGCPAQAARTACPGPLRRGETITSALGPLMRPTEFDKPAALETVEAAVVALLEGCPSLVVTVAGPT